MRSSANSVKSEILKLLLLISREIESLKICVSVIVRCDLVLCLTPKSYKFFRSIVQSTNQSVFIACLGVNICLISMVAKLITKQATQSDFL